MKRILGLAIILVLLSTMMMGCSSGTEKSEEELKAEILAEMKAEMEKEANASKEADANKEADPKGNEAANIETQEKQQNPTTTTETQEKNTTGQPDKPANALIEADEARGYFKYKANMAVNFDIDMDGRDEEIKYEPANGKLIITGYKAVDIDTMFAEKEHFIIIKFSDKYNTEMNMIGIVDYGPSNDPTTSLYSITALGGKKGFGSVGAVPGELVSVTKYDADNMDDFNYKAILIRGEGIEAPVRLSVLPATWFGRNLFTFYTTYNSLIDNIEKYGQDYETKMVLRAERDVRAYSEKDKSSASITIKAGQDVYVLATDNSEWIAMLTEEAVGGWVYISDIDDSFFSGYPIFD